MKQYDTFENLKTSYDAAIGIESVVCPDLPTYDVTLRYHSPTGVELLRIELSNYDKWRVASFGQYNPLIKAALEAAGREVTK